MRLEVVTDEAMKAELLAQSTGVPDNVSFSATIAAALHSAETTTIIDLLFDGTTTRRNQLRQALPGLAIVNSVTNTLADLDLRFVRINGWPGLLRSPVIEASCTGEGERRQTEEIFRRFNKRVHWVDDVPGFITPRVVASIINEACFALEEAVSSMDEIDLAMKLGTSYPFGPFEWCRKITAEQVRALLERMSHNEPRYKPAKLLYQI